MNEYKFLKGVVSWAKVHQPDTDLNGNKKFSIEVDISQEEANLFIGKKIKVKNRVGGVPYVKIKTNAVYPDGKPVVLRIADANGDTLTKNIGNGSVCKIAYKEHEYDNFGGGISLILHGVMVLELIEYEGGSTDPFERV